MERKCLKCEKIYQVKTLFFDSGYCVDCKPSFFSMPKITPASPAQTKSLLIGMIGIHVFLLLCFSMLLDNGVISNPAYFYFSGSILYLFIRFMIWQFSKDGFPCLSLMQRFAILLMPFYGLPVFLLIWRSIRTFFFND
jgi:hypothetical protein